MTTGRTMTDFTQISSDILKRPYSRLLVPEEDGSYRAEIFEFPGCIAIGETASDALKNLEEVAADWIAAALENGQQIPAPVEAEDFSGKLVLRLSRSLHRRASFAAEREGVSLNQFISTAVATCVGASESARVPTVSAQTYNFVANFNTQFNTHQTLMLTGGGGGSFWTGTDPLSGVGLTTLGSAGTYAFPLKVEG